MNREYLIEELQKMDTPIVAALLYVPEDLEGIDGSETLTNEEAEEVMCLGAKYIRNNEHLSETVRVILSIAVDEVIETRSKAA